jgi:hypothetical protein
MDWLPYAFRLAYFQAFEKHHKHCNPMKNNMMNLRARLVRFHSHTPSRFLLAAVLFAGTVGARGAVSNLTDLTTGYVGADYQQIGKDTVGHLVASTFKVGTTDLQLQNVEVNFASGFGGGFTAMIYDNTGVSGTPGALQMTLTGNTAPSNGLFLYTPSIPSSWNMNSGATYWLVLAVAQSGLDKQTSVSTVNAPSQVGDTGWEIGDKFMYQAVTNGVSDIWRDDAATPLQFAVNAVPEPSSWFLLAGGFGPLCLFRRSRAS